MGKKGIFTMAIVTMLLLAACGTDTQKMEVEPADFGNEISDAEASESTGQDTEASDSIEEENTEQEFVNINIDLEKVTLKIRSGDAFTFSYADGKEAGYTISDDTLYIHAREDGDLVLTLPDNSIYDMVAISVEEGNIYAEQLF